MSAPDDEGIARVLRRFPGGRPLFMLVSDLDHTMVRRGRQIRRRARARAGGQLRARPRLSANKARSPSSSLITNTHTQVQNEDPTHARQLLFNAEWQRTLAPRSLLVWSTGRSPALFRALWQEAPLLSPDVLVCSVGAEVFFRDPHTGAFVEDAGWARRLDAGGRWRRGEAEAAARDVPALAPQPASEQRPHKLSFRAPPAEAGRAAVAALRAALEARGLGEGVAKVVHSGGADVDVLAAGAGKGGALEAVRAALMAALAARAGEAGAAAAAAAAGPGAGGGGEGEPQTQPPPQPPPPLPLGFQVNGDSGNDAELFDVEGARGCIVANAHEELLEYYARRVERGAPGAAGAAGDKAGAAAGAGAGGAANGSGALHLASEPCCGGILETLRLFGTAEGMAEQEDAELGAEKAEELRRARELITSGALLAAGGTAAAKAAIAADGATAARADGRVVPLAEWAPGPVEGSGGVEWIDQLRTRHAGEGVVVATYERWWWCGCGGKEEEGAGAAATATATATTATAATAPGSGRRACLTTAVLRRRPGAGCEMEVVHVHEGPPVVAAAALERLDELVEG